MTSPTTNPPLWRVMQKERHGWTSVSTDTATAEACGPLYAAELRAIADWLVPEETDVPPGDLTEQAYRQDERFGLRAKLLAEADRAEAGG